jgi:hypothetical protein
MMLLSSSAFALTIAAAGDTMMGSDLKKGEAGLAPDNGAHLFDGVRDYLLAADLAFLNLEGPLADTLPDKKCKPGSTSCYAFRTPTRYTPALLNAGIDVVSLANNHAWDLGPEGQEATMQALDAVGIKHAGRTGDIARMVVKGLRVSLVAAHFGECCLNINDLDSVSATIKAETAQADIVIFSFHAGAEGSTARHLTGETEVAWGETRGNPLALAHVAVDAGADLVLGHGPHVLRAMEVYKERLIAYSLGNFCGFRQFGTQGGYGGTSIVLEAELAETGALVSARVRPVLLDSEAQPRPDASGAAIDQLNELIRSDFPNSILKISSDGRLSW